jgi:hypothetical protein
MEDKKEIHPSGLNIIENSDGSYYFEWSPTDQRWSWMNNLTDDQIRVIMEELIQKIEQLQNES